MLVKSRYSDLWAAWRLERRLRYRDLVAGTLPDLSDYHVQLAQYDSAAIYLRRSSWAFAKLHDLGGKIRCLGHGAPGPRWQLLTTRSHE